MYIYLAYMYVQICITLLCVMHKLVRLSKHDCTKSVNSFDNYNENRNY
jgi:hypothetical protein